MKILLLGIPGSGKTTQASRLLRDMDLELISVGAELRRLAEDDSEFGKKLKKAIESGDLVSDEIVAEVVKRKLESLEDSENFIIDGFPRTLEQLAYFNPQFDVVLYLKVTEELAFKRLLRRGRVDDRPEIIKHRFSIQRDEIEKLVHFFDDRAVVMEIDDKKDIESVHNEIIEDLKKWHK